MMLACLIVLAVLILPWLGARLFLSGASLAPFDGATGDLFGGGRAEHPNVAVAMARLTPSNTPPPGLTRAAQLAFKRDKFDHMFDDLAFDVTFTQIDADGVRGEWVTAPGADPARRMLYLHGGGFAVGSPRSHRPLTARMAAACGGAVLALDYRLLPEHRRIDGIEDCRHAYRWLLAHGPDGAAPAATVFVAGDSAGGNLTLSLLAWIRDAGLPAPAAAVAISPPTDATWSSPSIHANVATDHMLGPAIAVILRLPRTLMLWASWRQARIRPCDPLVSPVHGDLAGLPPLLVHVSATEMLYDDARRYVNKARAAGSPAMLQSWNNTLHVWHIFPELPESGEAFAEIARFLARPQGFRMNSTSILSQDVLAAPERTPLRAWYSLGVLAIVTLIAFIDRNILLLQAETIRKVLHLSDLQLGLLQGTAVAAFAAVATFPLGWLADRFDRRLVLAGCALFWSAAVVGCGMAQTYEQLLLASALVGGGEAGLVPIAYAMIPDMFGEKKRQVANSVFALASMSATSLAMALCGQVIGMVETVRPHLPGDLPLLDGWRLSFFAVALPAPVLVLMIATIYTHRQTARVTVAGHRSIAALGETVAALLPHLRTNRRTFLYFTSGIFSALFGFAAMGSWLAVIYLRRHGVSAKDLGAALGIIALVAVVVGFPVSIYGTRYFKKRIGAGVNIRSLWLTCVLAIVAIALMVFATSARQMFLIHGAYLVTLTAALLVYPTTLQALAPGHLRARTVAIVGMIASTGSAIAPPVTGFVSDHLKANPNGLMIAAALVSIPALALAVFLLAKCERYYVVTAEASRVADATLA